MSAPPEAEALFVRGDSHQATLHARRAFAYGDIIVREPPLLLVPKDASIFLRQAGTDAMIAVARQLGDVQRLAVFAAFARLPEAARGAVLAMGVSQGSTVVGDTKSIIAMFLKDFPQFAGALDWDLFARVVGTVSDRGSKLEGGERVLYRFGDCAAHSCSPNAVVETLGDSGMKELRVISHLGVAENEAISVSYLPEEVLLLPLDRRRAAIAGARRGWTCTCSRCMNGEDAEFVLPLLQRIAALGRDADADSLRECVKAVRRLDELLPFAVLEKARARSRLGQACEECGDGAFLRDAEELYETALDETLAVVGQKGLRNVDNLKRLLAGVREKLE